MSYKVTAYFDDPDIASTRIYGKGGFTDKTYAYGTSTHYGTDYSGKTQFTATPADGCEFVYWVYTLGSDTTEHISRSNPFIYESESVDISIRALGESEEGPPPTTDYWELYYAGSFSSIKNYTSAAFELVENEMIVYTVTFAYGGLAIFSTTGSVGTWGFLCDEYPSSVFDYDEGVPKTYLAQQDGAYGDFVFSWLVSPNTTYYVCVRGSFGNETGSVQLHIDPPTGGAWTVTESSITEPLTEDISQNMTLTPYELKRLTVRFAESGKAYFYTVGSLDVEGYLTSGNNTTADKANGKPASSYEFNDNGGGAHAYSFKIPYDVVAGVDYHIWVRCSLADKSGTTLFRIIVPGDFSWTHPKIKGKEFNLTATEWHNLMHRIDFIRRNRRMSGYGVSVSKGDTVTARIIDRARLAMQDIEGYGTYVPEAVKGEPITAELMNAIVSELNVIPKE